MLTTPTAYGAEFRQDVIDVARKGEAPLAQVAKDFGLSVITLKRWGRSTTSRGFDFGFEPRR
jgi:transposase